MKKYKALWLLVLVMGFFACEKEIAFNQKEIDPLVVMTCLTSPETTMKVSLSKSRFFLDNADTFPVINDAQVSLYVNEDSVETLQWVSAGTYRSVYVPKIGDEMRLEANVPGYPSVWAENTLTAPVTAFSIDTSIQLISYSAYPIDGRYGSDDLQTEEDTLWSITKEIEYTVNLNFTDVITTDDYYLISLKQYNILNGESTEISSNIKSMDVYSGEWNDYYAFSSSLSDDRFFSDELVNGKNISIRIILNVWDSNIYTADNMPVYDMRERQLTVSLSNISKSYYYYLKTIERADETDEFGSLFSEPVQVYNNIKNGVGLFGSFSEKKDSLVLTMP